MQPAADLIISSFFRCVHSQVLFLTRCVRARSVAFKESQFVTVIVIPFESNNRNNKKKSYTHTMICFFIIA